MHGVITMGRSRKPGKRHPGGQLIRKALEDRTYVAEIKRVIQESIAASRDKAFGTVFGRMCLRGEITPAQCAAAARYAILRARADISLGLPPRNPKAMDFNAVRGLDVNDEDPERDQQNIAAFDDAKKAVGFVACIAAVEHAVIEDREPNGEDQRNMLKLGLSRLVHAWKYDASYPQTALDKSA